MTPPDLSRRRALFGRHRLRWRHGHAEDAAPPLIAGTVSNAAGLLEFADVTAYRRGRRLLDQRRLAYTDATGHYEFTDLTARWRLPARLQCVRPGRGVLERQAETVEQGENVTVVAGTTKTADAQLADPLLITGTVTGTGGAQPSGGRDGGRTA